MLPVPSCIYRETTIGYHPLSLGSSVCRPIDRNALNRAFGKIYCHTKVLGNFSMIYHKGVFCCFKIDLVNPLARLPEQSLSFLFDSLKEKVHLSTCHFRLIKNQRGLESALDFSRILKIGKESCIKMS